MLYTLTLNPTIDHTLTVEGFAVGGTYKASADARLPAGKGINAARVIATLGAPVAALGLVGEQDAAAFAAALCTSGIENRLTAVPGATRSSVTILDPLAGTETHLREQGRSPPRSAMAAVRSAIETLARGDWLILAGSLPPGLAADTYRALCERCAARGVQTLLDANGPSLLAAVDAPPTLLKPNLFELWQIDRGQAEAVAEEPTTARAETDAGTGEILSAARRVQQRGARMVVVSLGARGVVGLDAQGRAWRASVALEQRAVDAVGSGDALGAGLALALAQGASFAEALRLGVACGAANTLLAGAGRCRRSDVERLAGRVVVAAIGGP